MDGTGSPKVANVGYGFYGFMAPTWPAQESLRLLDALPHPRLSVLWNTFGTKTGPLEEYLQFKKPHALELHLLNESGLRNNRLGAYETLYGLTVSSFERKLLAQNQALRAKLTNYFAGIATFIEKHRNSSLHLFISPSLESNLSLRAARELYGIASAIFGGIGGLEYVWSPVGGGPGDRPANFGLFEGHGSSPGVSDIVNLDGCDISWPERRAILPQYIPSSAIPAYLSKYHYARANFLWIAECNGIRPGSFVDPRKRKNWPSPRTFKLLDSSARNI